MTDRWLSSQMSFYSVGLGDNRLPVLFLSFFLCAEISFVPICGRLYAKNFIGLIRMGDVVKQHDTHKYMYYCWYAK